MKQLRIEEIEQADLYPYGIYEENSDIRAHVSVKNKTIYIFKTIEGIKAIEKHSPPLVEASQDGITGRTALGWLVKIEWIEDLQRKRYHSWDKWKIFNKNLSTSEKGKLAVECVLEIMEKGRFPLWIKATEDERKNIQIEGTDILVFCNHRIQVKCDYKCGEQPNGTGNLFLQKAERNPLKRY